MNTPKPIPVGGLALVAAGIALAVGLVLLPDRVAEWVPPDEPVQPQRLGPRAVPPPPEPEDAPVSVSQLPTDRLGGGPLVADPVTLY